MRDEDLRYRLRGLFCDDGGQDDGGGGTDKDGTDKEVNNTATP